MVAASHIETRRPNLFHLQPVLALRLTLCQSHLLEEDIGGIEDTRSISSICAFVTTELCQLARLDLRGFLVAVVLSKQVAAELGCCYARFAQVCIYLFAYFIAAVVDFY